MLLRSKWQDLSSLRVLKEYKLKLMPRRLVPRLGSIRRDIQERMFFETRGSHKDLHVVSTFPEALEFASWIVGRSNSTSSITIVDGCISIYSDSFLSVSELEYLRTSSAYTFYKTNEWWSPISVIAVQEYQFNLGEDCMFPNMFLHAYMRFDASKLKQWKNTFDQLFPEYFGILCPQNNIELNITIDKLIRVKTIIQPFILPRRISSGGFLYVTDGKKATVSTLFELGIDSYGENSVIVRNVEDLAHDAILWRPVFETNPEKIDDDYSFEPHELFARKNKTHFSEHSFREHFDLFCQCLQRVMDLVNLHFPGKTKSWAPAVFSEQSFSDGDIASSTNLLEVSIALKNYKVFTVYAVNVNYHGFKTPSFFLQFQILDAIVTAVDNALELDARAQLGSLCFQMEPVIKMAEVVKAEVPQPQQPYVFQEAEHQDNQEPPKKKMKYVIKSNNNFSTVQNAWNLIIETPVLGHVSAESKARKMKTLLSNMRGNRFAKPPEGSAKRGGNNRDVEEKKIHVLREFVEASSFGVTREEFYDLMKLGGVLYTKSGKRNIDQEDDGIHD